MDPNEINDSVALAAEALATDKPAWYEAVNPQTLDLRGGTDCVLGQAYSDGAECCGWCAAPNRLRGYYAFDPNSGDRSATEAAWLARITALRSEYVQTMLGYGWLLSRDSLSLLSPATGRELGLEPLSKEQLQELLSA